MMTDNSDSDSLTSDHIGQTLETTNHRSMVHQWLFVVEGGHGWTLRTRRRIEDTRPSGVDPVNAPNVARGSQRVAQGKKSSYSHLRCLLLLLQRAGAGSEHPQMLSFFEWVRKNDTPMY